MYILYHRLQPTNIYYDDYNNCDNNGSTTAIALPLLFSSLFFFKRHNILPLEQQELELSLMMIKYPLAQK